MTTDRITLPELEQYLAKAADLLRGSIDQADFKAYIFPLMFFKRINDVYLEEFTQALEESGGDHEFAAFAENHRFAIPDGNLWADVRSHTENIGTALQTAFREIEKANPETLYGIFGNANWTNKDKLPDRKLADLIEHFSTKTLSNAAVAPDVFGNAYEYLIKRFADQSNKKAGEYYTPRSVVGLLINILNPVEGESVYDPACGTGGMLIEVIEHVKSAGGSPKTLWGKLYGQEKVLATSSIARMNLLLHGVEDFKIVREDTLRNPAFYTGNHLAQFDCVVANPPFSLKNWGETEWASDKWGRNSLGGVPAQGVRRLGVGAAHAHLGPPQDRPGCRRPASGRAVPAGSRGEDPHPYPQVGHRRRRDRPGAQLVLRHRPRRVCPHPPPAEAARGEGQGALHQRRASLQARPQPEHA